MNIDKYLNEIKKDSAVVGYEKAEKEIKSYLKNIQKNLINHKKVFSSKSTNWAMVGDLNRLSKDLKNINEYFI